VLIFTFFEVRNHKLNLAEIHMFTNDIIGSYCHIINSTKWYKENFCTKFSHTHNCFALSQQNLLRYRSNLFLNSFLLFSLAGQTAGSLYSRHTN